MGLAKTGYETAVKGTMSEKVNLNANGYIAQSGETVAGTKRISINATNAGNDLDTNHSIMEAFMGFVGGTSDIYSNKFAVTWEADQT